MTEFTEREFRKEFGFHPKASFDIKLHVTPMHKAEILVSLPHQELWAEYGICKDFADRKAHYMLEVSWWVLPITGELYGRIEKVILFDEYIEMMLHMREQKLKCTRKITNLN
jgi:hypothetical protein